MNKICLVKPLVFLLFTVCFSCVVLAESVTISAPRQAGINQSIEVTYSGPLTKGDMLRFANEAGKILGGHYLYVGNLKNNMGKLSAPVEPGSYQVVYVSNGEIVASSPLDVVAVSATVSIPASAHINDTVQVAFNGPKNSGDYVQVVTSSGEPVRGYYTYVGSAKNDIVNLRMPMEPGAYGVGYFTGKKLIGSSPILVKGVTATVSAPASVGANETFEVSFSGPLNHGDYLQFVNNDKPMSGLYRYVSPSLNNVANLTAPGDAGDYRIAYFTGKQDIGSTAIKVSAINATLGMADSVNAGSHFSVAWQGPANNGDMIRVLRPDGTNAGSYAYVGHNPETVTLRAPEENGEFRVAYFSGGRIVGETTFSVAAVSAELDAPSEVEGNQPFKVTWKGPGNYGDTLQLVDSEASGSIAYTYVDSDRGRVATILAPNLPGQYELRYLTHGKKVLAATTISITPAKLEPGLLQVIASQKPQIGPNDAIEVVLDASGSMLQRQSGERRIDIAKRTLTSLITETVPVGTPFVLRVFGHKEADKCRTDLEIALAPLNRELAISTIDGVTAMNLAKTPIADSLAQTDNDLSTVTGERIIVLVTDGEETCDGDPADVIAKMRADGRNIRVNIVGYAIDDGGLRDSFARWADLGGGQYFNAADESDLAAALSHAVNPSFVVKDEAGAIIAQGIAGGSPLDLAAGSYSLVTDSSQQQVEIQPAKRTTVTLK